MVHSNHLQNQTLLTPHNLINLIWFPIFLLQGLFIYASTIHKTLQTSPLIGYNAALTSPKQSIVVHYPAVCATTLMMIYSHDYGYPFFAFLSSVLCGVVLTSIIRIQSEILNEVEMNESVVSDNEEAGYVKDEDHANAALSTIATDIKSRSVQYFCLRLPFELYGGYVLALIASYFNMFLNGFDSLPTLVFLVIANVSLVGLLGVGFLVLWKIPERKFYGVGASLVWYLVSVLLFVLSLSLHYGTTFGPYISVFHTHSWCIYSCLYLSTQLGVAIELHEPTQPIYNEFSDGAILTTQIVAGVAATVLMTLLGVRVMKTMIKHNLFNCVGRLGGGDNASVATDEDGGISANYVHA